MPNARKGLDAPYWSNRHPLEHLSAYLHRSKRTNRRQSAEPDKTVSGKVIPLATFAAVSVRCRHSTRPESPYRFGGFLRVWAGTVVFHRGTVRFSGRRSSRFRFASRTKGCCCPIVIIENALPNQMSTTGSRDADQRRPSAAIGNRNRPAPAISWEMFALRVRQCVNLFGR